VLKLRYTFISVSGTIEKSALMKMHLKLSSVTGRSGGRLAYSPSGNISSEGILELADQSIGKQDEIAEE
jgi:hypothetical protein